MDAATRTPQTTVFRLGTRRSALALAQSSQVARALEARHRNLEVELVPILTQGDRLPGDLSQHGGKGLFTEELEQGLLDGTLDLAVHSLKDLPVHLPDGLTIAAYPERADPRDVLISEVATDLDELEPGAVLLTGSLRRGSQIRHRRPDVRVEPLRGNVDTRIRKWRDSGAAGVILAAAGLARLGLDGVPAHPLDPQVLVPAPGQGTLALEVKSGSRAEAVCAAIASRASAQAAEAERRIVRAFGGDCTLPLGAWARWDDGRLRLTAVLATPDGERLARGDSDGASVDEAARACLDALRSDGADEVLARLGR